MCFKMSARKVNKSVREQRLAMFVARKSVERTDVDGGAQVVNVGDEDVLLALGEELVEEARVDESGEDVAVAGRIPILEGAVDVVGQGQKGLPEDPRVAALVEGLDLELVVLVLAQDLLRHLVRVERVHEHERHVGVVLLVQVLCTGKGNKQVVRTSIMWILLSHH
jgi:hypothetical protein